MTTDASDPDQPDVSYRANLALVHDRGFGAHADACAPGILELLAPVRDRGGLVVELGCGSGALTRHLLDAGHRVLATDASAAMVDLARERCPDAEGLRRLVLPDDPIPEADAVVAVGHVLSYLPDEAALWRALADAADALSPAGVLALDLCDLELGRARADTAPSSRVEEDWAIVVDYSLPSPDRFVRAITTFVRSEDRTFRRDDERHVNVLIDTRTVPDWLAQQGVTAEVRPSFGAEKLPPGLVAVVGHRR